MTNFFGIDLLATKNIILAVITAVLMFFQMKLTTLVQPKQPAQKLPT
jgi:membrane protein insertase Oxa1/YidC/SpoIIIJ